MGVVGGVDCHKGSHTVVFIDAVGFALGCLTFETTDTGFEAALSMGEELGCSEWGLEGSGCYGYAFAIYISLRGASVFEVPGSYTKRHRRHASQRGKSDARDARAVAEAVLRERGRLPRFQVTVAQRALRLRYDQRDRLVRERTRAVNRLRSAAVQLGITRLPPDLTTSRSAERLSSQIVGFRQEVQLHAAGEAIADEMADAVEDVLRLNGKIRAAERQIRRLVRSVAPQLLQLRGVSHVVAAGLIGHTGDLRNVRNAAAFAMKAGVAPVPCSSGRNKAVRVNAGGDRQLNRLLHIVAITQVRSADHPGRRYYDRKRAEGKTHRAAIRCLKRQLATVVYYRLRETSAELPENEEIGDIAA